MARPRKKIDPEQVKQLAMIGCSVEEMASVLGCTDRTLQRRFVTALKEGRLKAKSSLRKKQFEMAMAGNPTMLVWLGKQWLGQTDKQEISGPDGGPIQHEHVDLTRLTDEQLTQVESLIESARRTTPERGTDTGGMGETQA